MIPSTIHFVWSGQRFPLAFTLAVRSAASLHPGWKLVIHVIEEPVGVPAWESLRPLAEIRPIDPVMVLSEVPHVGAKLVELYRAIAPSYHAGRSNLVRLAILAREGGWYLDFDTLTIHSLEALSKENDAIVGEEWVWKYDEARVARGYRPCMILSSVAFGISWVLARLGVPDRGWVERFLRSLWGRRELNNAVLACAPGNPWFVRLLELATRQNPAIRFALGPSLVNLGWRDPGDTILPHRLGPEAFYQFPPSQTCRYFGTGSLPEGALVLHWCSSNHRDLCRHLGPHWVSHHSKTSPWASYAIPILKETT